MKSFKLNHTSWHYKLAVFGQSDKNWLYHSGTDICAYTRLVVIGLIKVLLMLSLLGLLLAVGVIGLYDVVMTLFYGAELKPFGAAFIGVFGGITAGILFAAIKVANDNRKLKRASDESTPGFVGLAYRKFKDKTCFKIEFK